MCIRDRGEVVSFFLAQYVFKMLVYLHLDSSRSAFEHVYKGLMLAVEVAQEVLRSFWKRKYGFEVDDLRRGGFDVRLIPRKAAEVFEICHYCFLSAPAV